MLLIILLVLLVVFAFGGFGYRGRYPGGWSFSPLGLILLILLIAWLAGAF